LAGRHFGGDRFEDWGVALEVDSERHAER
jgi:hypothetical protein